MQTKRLTIQQFFGRLATLLVLLAMACVVLIVVGLNAPPRVLGYQLLLPSQGSTLTQIVITFNRPMDRHSVEGGFEITPQVSGKYSWSGRSFVFTPDETLQYDQHFEVKLSANAVDEDGRHLSEDMRYVFNTPQLQFVYVGVDGDEAGRLVLSDFDGKERDILTPEGLHIDKFAVTNDRHEIYCLGYTEIVATNHRDELYTFNLQTKEFHQLTDDANFLNKDFFLDPTGKHLLLSRVQVSPAGVYLTKQEAWIASTSDNVFHKFLNGDAVGTTMFSPDGSYILYKNLDGNYEVAKVDAQDDKASVFVGNYDDSYGFHPFKPLLIFNRYDTTDLFSMNNFMFLFSGNGSVQKIDFQQPGLSRDTVFLPNGKGFVTIFSKKDEAFDDKDSFYPLRIFHVYYYDLERQTMEQLTSDMDFSEEGQAISPDSRYVLFQRYETFGPDVVIDPAYRSVTDSLGNVQSGGEIWRMDLQTEQLVKLPMKGTDLEFLP